MESRDCKRSETSLLMIPLLPLTTPATRARLSANFTIVLPVCLPGFVQYSWGSLAALLSTARPSPPGAYRVLFADITLSSCITKLSPGSAPSASLTSPAFPLFPVQFSCLHPAAGPPEPPVLTWGAPCPSCQGPGLQCIAGVCSGLSPHVAGEQVEQVDPLQQVKNLVVPGTSKVPMKRCGLYYVASQIQVFPCTSYLVPCTFCVVPLTLYLFVVVTLLILFPGP